MSAPSMSYGNITIDVGVLIDDGHLYETEGFNKVPAVAIPKNAGVLNFNASGQMQVCPTAGLGPFCFPGEDANANDLRVSVYGQKARGIKYTLKNSAALVANDPVKPSTTVAGQVEKFVKGTDSLEKLIGYFRGLLDQGADLTSKAVLQANATAANMLCVIEKA
jgi:hypothetical protein